MGTCQTGGKGNPNKGERYTYSPQKQPKIEYIPKNKKQQKDEQVIQSQYGPSQRNNFSQKKVKQIMKVMTLNYSGILLSPFQFYPQEKNKEYLKLSQLFQAQLEEMRKEQSKNKNIPENNKMKQEFSWNIGNIDKEIQRQRYTPVYNKKAGLKKHQNGITPVDNNNENIPSSPCFCCDLANKHDTGLPNKHKQRKLQTYHEFKESWDKAFKPFQSKYKQKDKQQTSKFDLLCYKAFLKYVYSNEFSARTSQNINDKQHPEEEEKFIRSLDRQKYAKFMQQHFNKVFINESLKIDNTIKKLKRIGCDVVFLQQTTNQLKNRLKSQMKGQYYIEQCSGESAILLSRSRFAHEKSSSFLRDKIEHIDKINWNQDSLGVKIDNYIFICAHLSSKSSKNTQQKKQMLKDLQKLSQQHQNQCIILGGDLNSYLQKAPQGFKKYPLNESQITTIKKRTSIQTQVNKANKVIKQSKDHILSNCQIMKRSIWTIDQQLPDPSHYLPTNDHPYDHYLVYAEIVYECQVQANY